MESFSNEFKGTDITPSGITSINTSYMMMDFALGGGISEGQWLEIFGPEGAGKTTNALCMCSYYLAMNPDAYLMYLDIEKATSYERITNIFLQSTVEINEETGAILIDGEERGILICPDTFEKIALSFDKFSTLCIKNKLRGIIVWDSLVAAVSEKIIKEGTERIAYKATEIQNLIDKFSSLFQKIPITQLVINQTRQKMAMGMFDSKKGDGSMVHEFNLPGGNAHKFKAFQTLQMSIGKKWGYPTTTPIIDGVVIKFTPTKNKLGAPKKEFDQILVYEIGFSNLISLLYFLNEKKLLDGRGLSSIKFGGMLKGLNLEKFSITIATDKEFATKFFDFCFDVLTTEYKAYSKMHRFDKDVMLNALILDAAKLVRLFNSLKQKGIEAGVEDDVEEEDLKEPVVVKSNKKNKKQEVPELIDGLSSELTNQK